MKPSVVLSLVAIFFVSLLVFPTLSAQQSGQIISSQGVIGGGGNIGWLHTDGKYIRNEQGEAVPLRGCAFIEAAYCVDELQHTWTGQTLADRAERFKELGVNYVRLPVHKQHWDANTDTNGDGVGHRDFVDQAIQEFTSRGIYVIPGFHYGIDLAEEDVSASPQIWIDWLINNLVNRYIDNRGVAGIYIWNEPHYGRWGGTDLGGGVTSGWWNAAKEACRQIHEANPKLLIVVHANMNNEQGFCPILRTDPIPVPNVVYTWHYYYHYGPTLVGSYETLAEQGKPYYQTYADGNYELAKEQFEQSLYDRFLWVPTELDLPIVNDEFGFNGNEVAYDAVNPDLPPEPGWPQCMHDFLEIMNKYYCNWNHYAWWGKVQGSYGLALDTGSDAMMALSNVGEVWKDHLNAPT